MFGRRVKVALSAGVCALALAGAAWAQAFDFNIPGGDLRTALDAYIRQSGTQLIYRVDDVRGKTTAGVRGSLSPDEALSRLLQGSGFVVTREPGGAAIITRVAEVQTEPAEIVVTAQKRTQRLVSVPLAVTALGGETLGQRQIHDTDNLTAAVPSLTFQQGNNPTNTTFRIRGVGTTLFGQGTESSVSVVVDGVVAARQAQGFADVADIERIEVLRGPQGTLFGKNATAGVIHIVTARPTRTFSARADVTLAEGDEQRYSLSLSGPITDTLRYRVSGYDNHVGGHLDNIHTGETVGGSEGWGLRGKLEWQPGDNLTFLLSSEYKNKDAQCCEGVLTQASNPNLIGLDGTAIGPENRQVNNDGLTWSKARFATTSLQADYDAGFATLTSITAYQRFSIRNNFEPDRAPTEVPVWFGATSQAAVFNYNRGYAAIRDFSHETRLSSREGGSFAYVVGLFYDDLEVERLFGRRAAYCATGTFGEPCTPVAWRSLSHHALANSKTYAVFGQGEYELTQSLRLLAGLRLQKDEIAIRGQRLGPIEAGDGVLGPADTALTAQSERKNAVSGKLGLQYVFNRNAQAYASVTRGYKGPGYDTEISADFGGQDSVKPEYVTSYEGGYKFQSADGVFRFFASAWYSDYTDLQIQATRLDPATETNVFVQTNAGSASTRGLEIEGGWRPTAAFSLDGALAYTDTSVDADGLSCPVQEQAPDIRVYGVGEARPVNACYKYQYQTSGGAVLTSGFVQDVRGGSLPVSPKWRLSLSPRYEHPLGERTTGFVQAHVSYTSSQHYAIEQDEYLTQKGYTLVDLNLGLRHGSYTLTLFAKNLFDQNYYNSLIHSVLLSSYAYPDELTAYFPKSADRYLGLSLSARF